MKAAVFHEPHVPLALEELELEGPKAGEVLVEMVGAGVCHSDYHYMDGHIVAPDVPLVMGHEGAGIIRQTGPGVTSVGAGDKIIFTLDAMCGHCRNCTLGQPTLCQTYRRSVLMPDGTPRFSKNGVPYYHFNATFSQHTVVPADKVVKVPGDSPLEKACLLGCSVITGVGAVVNQARVEAGSTMAVFGCGGVGLNVVQGGILASASKIIAVDKVDFKLTKAEEMGATHFVNADREDPVKRIVEITGGGADYSFEVVGFPAVVQQAFQSVRRGGTAVMVGVQPTDAEISVNARELLVGNKTLVGAWHGAARPRVDYLWLLYLYKQGRLKLDELITRYRPLEEVDEAFEDMNSDAVARTVLTFG